MGMTDVRELERQLEQARVENERIEARCADLNTRFAKRAFWHLYRRGADEYQLNLVRYSKFVIERGDIVWFGNVLMLAVNIYSKEWSTTSKIDKYGQSVGNLFEDSNKHELSTRQFGQIQRLIRTRSKTMFEHVRTLVQSDIIDADMEDQAFEWPVIPDFPHQVVEGRAQTILYSSPFMHNGLYIWTPNSVSWIKTKIMEEEQHLSQIAGLAEECDRHYIDGMRTGIATLRKLIQDNPL
jgi:hypothetical protein